MTLLPLGDLAMSFQQKLHGTRIRRDIARLTDELASGRRSDLREATAGHFGAFAAIEHQLRSLAAHKTSAEEASLFASSLQVALGTVQESSADLAPLLLESADSAHASWISATSSDSRARFSTVVSTLNTSAADRTLLGGTATTGPALADAETMLGDLAAAVVAETTAVGVETIVIAWFDDPGGGFETNGYLGSTTALSPFRVGSEQSVSLPATAADQEIRDLLKSYALAALADAGALDGLEAEQGALLGLAGERMFNANADVVELRGRIGAAEAAIEVAISRNVSETTALRLTRNQMIAADPYDAAVDLEAAQLQLEALYTITARAARLTLTDFLR
ncbi:flagellin [Pseudoruegeria sp. HB172150]|uniref:flagellin n=1 Tax=Pseudoruegeria sp. HB172150 TaxID=2721164 RepID=UPI0015565B83|nr:flagellin [Pseudoruegeria sp. HB172150]